MKQCINCGKTLADSAKFCPRCGKKQPITNQDSNLHYKVSKNGIKYLTDDNTSPRQKNKRSKIALLTVGVLIIIGLMIFGGIKIHNRMQMVSLPSNLENRTINFNGNSEQPPLELHMHTDTMTLSQNFGGKNEHDNESYNIIGVHHTTIKGITGTKISLKPNDSHSPLSSIFFSNQGRLYTQTSNNSNMYPRNHR